MQPSTPQPPQPRRPTRRAAHNTHIPTWDELRALVGSPGFLYVADSKLCSKQAMSHIASHGGRFVTVVPHGRREDTWFRDWAQTHAPAWAEADRRPGARLGDPDRVWRTFEAPAPSADGYRVIWVHSSTKAARDAAARAARIEAGLAAIDAVAARLTSPKSRLRTKVAAEAAATTALTAAGATRWVGATITETTEETGTLAPFCAHCSTISLLGLHPPMTPKPYSPSTWATKSQSGPLKPAARGL